MRAQDRRKGVDRHASLRPVRHNVEEGMLQPVYRRGGSGHKGLVLSSA